MKHLLYEHQHALAVLKEDGEAALKQAGDDAAAREADLRRDLRTLQRLLREQARARPCECRAAPAWAPGTSRGGMCLHAHPALDQSPLV